MPEVITEAPPAVRTENPIREAAPLVRVLPTQRVEHMPLVFTAEQRQMIKDIYAKEASDSEFAVLMEIARLRRLNPLLGQVHFVARPVNLGSYDNPRWGKKWAVQVGIDGFRARAEENPNYDGQSPRRFEFDAAGIRLVSCTVTVYRRDKTHPFEETCFYNEFVQTTKKGGPVEMWLRKPHVMLGKCTEAAALRKAFPEELGGLYEPDEMPDDEQLETKPSEIKTVRNDGLSDAPFQAEPKGDPTQPTPEERAADIEEKIKVCTKRVEVLALVPLYKALPEGFQAKFKALAMAKAEACDKAEHAPPAAERQPGSEG